MSEKNTPTAAPLRRPLVIPFDDQKYAVIPMGITAEDFDLLQKTLELWKSTMITKAPPTKRRT